MADTARQLICLSQFIFAQFGKTINCLTDYTQKHCFVSARQFKIVLPRLNICLTDISFVCFVCNLGQTIYIVLPRLHSLLSCSACIYTSVRQLSKTIYIVLPKVRLPPLHIHTYIHAFDLGFQVFTQNLLDYCISSF